MAPGWPGTGATQAANKPAALPAAAILRKVRRDTFVDMLGSSLIALDTLNELDGE
jgi:hypothetical protein